MTESTGDNRKQRGSRVLSVVLGCILLVLAGYAVYSARDSHSSGGFFGLGGGSGTTTVRGVIGSEKRDYFEDPEVKERLEKLGYTVEFSTAGSRQIATSTDLEKQDFVFPSSGPAAQKVKSLGSNYSVDYPFFTPMAIASWKPLAEMLEREGVVHSADGGYAFDMAAYIKLVEEGKRWRDLGDGYASPRQVQVTTTDIRTSNSAAMYLSLLAWQFQEEEPGISPDALVDKIAPFFVGQGYSESSSSAPFRDYLSQGMGSMPLVLVYEAQFLGEQMKERSRIREDMVLMRLEPTVVANHGIVGISDGGKELGRLLSTDPELQQLAAKHGFRPAESGSLAEELEAHGLPAPSDYVNSVDPPTFDQLEQLLDGVGERYGGQPPANEEATL